MRKRSGEMNFFGIQILKSTRKANGLSPYIPSVESLLGLCA
jgi:hypothetical protein